MNIPFEINQVNHTLLVSWLETKNLDMRFGFFSDSVKYLCPKHRYQKISPIDTLFHPEYRDGLRNIGLIFHTARCGSTLLCQMLKQHKRCMVISEPLIVSQLFNNSRFSFDEKFALLGGILKYYSAWGASLGKYVVLKTTSWQIQYFEVFHRLVECSPKLFLFRHPNAVLKSLVEKPPAWINKRIQDQLSNASRLSVAANAYKDTTSIMIKMSKLATTASLDFKDLSNEIGRIPLLFGLDVDEGLLKQMKQQSKINAKSRTIKSLNEYYMPPQGDLEIESIDLETQLTNNYSTLSNHENNIRNSNVEVASAAYLNGAS